MSLRKTDLVPNTSAFAADQHAVKEAVSTVLLRTYGFRTVAHLLAAIRKGVMHPWYIATETFTSRHEGWTNYVAWSGLSQLDEVVSLDSMLCGSLLPEIKGDYWPHIVNEEFMAKFFVDLDFLLAQLPEVTERNLLCVYRNPPNEPQVPAGSVNFEFLGYDLVEGMTGISALTNCGGFSDVFDNRELSSKGLLTSRARAFEVQSELRTRYPNDPHADCHVWAIFRAGTSRVRFVE